MDVVLLVLCQQPQQSCSIPVIFATCKIEMLMLSVSQQCCDECLMLLRGNMNGEIHSGEKAVIRQLLSDGNTFIAVFVQVDVLNIVYSKYTKTLQSLFIIYQLFLFTYLISIAKML